MQGVCDPGESAGAPPIIIWAQPKLAKAQVNCVSPT